MGEAFVDPLSAKKVSVSCPIHDFHGFHEHSIVSHSKGRIGGYHASSDSPGSRNLCY